MQATSAHRITTSSGITLSYDRGGSGPPLILVHGAFSDHDTNWTFIKPALRKSFTVYAMARRGRGGTSATTRHSLLDEVSDLVTLIETIREPVHLLGHSYGAHCVLEAARWIPTRIRRVIAYEPAWPSILTPEALVRLELLAAERAWDAFATTFFCDTLFVPRRDVDTLRATAHWQPILADARASLGDLRALARHEFRPHSFENLRAPVLLQIGTESPRHLYVTDALARTLVNARIGPLEGQAHEAMTTAPDQYVDAVVRFLNG